MPGETSEGQPAPLNPQVRADIDQALANAGVKGELNPKATEDIDRTLNQAGADSLKGPATLPAKENAPYMGVTTEQGLYDPNNLFSPLNDIDIYDPRTKPRNERPELATVREHAGVTISKFKYDGPRILRPEDRGMGTTMDYEGFTIDTPDVRLAVFKGPLSGETFVKTFDREGNLLEEATFHGNLGEIWAKAADTYSPNELMHVVLAAGRLSLAEREQIKQDMKATGGRDKYVMQEAERLVEEGQFANITDARWAVITQIEISPSSPRAERKIIEAVNAGEIPEDITDSEEAEKIMQELDFCARYPGMVEEFARKVPELMRIATMTPEEKARFTYQLAQTLTETILGENNAGKIPFENSQQLTQVELNASNLGGNKAGGIIDVLNYAWDKVVRLQQKAGLSFGRPHFRII